jgi:hypothetical protein
MPSLKHPALAEQPWVERIGMGASKYVVVRTFEMGAGSAATRRCDSGMSSIKLDDFFGIEAGG